MSGSRRTERNVQQSVTSEAPRPRDAAATRTRILDAALAEFSARGLDGARVDEIAARAGTNKRLLYAYVGNKEELWLATLERTYAAMRAAERALDVAALAPEAAMRRLVRFNARWHAEHPEFIALLNAENLHKARHLRQSELVPRLYSPLLGLIRELLERGAATGVFRPGIDPMQLYISIASLSYFYCSNISTLSVIFGQDLATPEALAERFDHVEDVILRFLRP